MPKLKDKFLIFQKAYLQAAGILLLLILAVLLLCFNNLNSYQASNALVAQVRFYGQYRIGDGPWLDIVEGEHISATSGDVTLRGDFHMLTPDGEYVGIYDGDTPIAFYINHINLTFFEGGSDPGVTDMENPMFGDSACGAAWIAHSISPEREGPIEILIHNPHRFGNETAIDEMLSNIALWAGISFEKDILSDGKVQRNTALVIVVVSFVLLGTALFSVLLHIQSNRIIWLLGLSILSAGVYLAYNAPGASLWSESITTNTTTLGISMILYLLFLSGIITHFLHGTKNIGKIVITALGVLDGAFFLLPVVTDIFFYDTWLFWTIAQTAANAVLFVCLIKDWFRADKTYRWLYVGMMLMIIAFEVDTAATALGYWHGGFVSIYVFFALFIATLVTVLRVIPGSINAAVKAQELELQRSRLEAEKNMIEAELKESRIAIMLSQIQPHFIYNTLGTIERMCLKDPEKAFDLVRNFSLYLRGNFRELNSITPIRFAEELKHVEHYVNIEKVRFPDMSIEYDVETTDFVLPALSVQPLVENAIKHGLMRLETGGTVVIRSYETATHFCVEVKDDGAGFDPNLPIDEKKHVGLRNIRGRLKAMVNGELSIDSKPGVGTRAVIRIPKEVIE